MASGKTTIGKLIAKKMNYNFIDLDDYIIDKEKQDITQIFNSKGEIYFRKKETQYLTEIINNQGNLILSLGGGTPCYGNNMEILLKAPNVTTIYLKASIKTLTLRLKNQKDQRPLISHLTSGDELTEFIGKHMFERSPIYSKAQLVFSTDDKSESEIAETIILELF